MRNIGVFLKVFEERILTLIPVCLKKHSGFSHRMHNIRFRYRISGRKQQKDYWCTNFSQNSICAAKNSRPVFLRKKIKQISVLVFLKTFCRMRFRFFAALQSRLFARAYIIFFFLFKILLWETKRIFRLNLAKKFSANFCFFCRCCCRVGAVAALLRKNQIRVRCG